MSDSEKGKAFIEAIRGFNRTYGIAEATTEIKETDFPEIAKSIHWECVPYPVPKIMDTKDIFMLLKRIKG